MHCRSTKKLDSRQTPGGIAAVELAVCLPVIMLLVLAMIECCTMIFLKQSVTIAAYEGVRTAILEDAVADDVHRTSEQILKERRVKGATITIRPNNFQELPIGEFLEVTVSAPAEMNSVIPGSFFRGKTLSGTATMMKEF